MSAPEAGPHRVVFTKNDEEWIVDAGEGESLLDAAHRCGAPVHTLCNGIAACVQCKVRVVGDDSGLNRVVPIERDRLGNVYHLTHERLACQAQVCGPVLVQCLDVRLPRRGKR